MPWAGTCGTRRWGTHCMEMALGHGWWLSQQWDSKVGCLEHKGRSRKDPNALFRRQNKSHDHSRCVAKVWVCGCSMFMERDCHLHKSLKTNSHQPGLVLGNPEGTAEWIMESWSTCSAQTPQSTSPQPQLVTKPPVGTHTFSSAPFAERGTGGWQSPSALGGKDTSPATSWHKWTAWKRKSKWESF